jgi:hypothetical protein
MMINRRSIVASSLMFLSTAAPRAEQHPPMPAGMTHGEHLAQMQKDEALKKRGAVAMGFDQDSSTHHFLLSADGGAIEVSVNEASDTTNRDAIRSHLKEIAVEFTHGDFAKPLATHGEVPPGVKTMQQRLRLITFRYEDVVDGGRVRIQTADRKAKIAVQEFLRYQIREHSTGDPLS